MTKMLAVCHKCGGPGMYTQRIVHSEELVVLGAQELRGPVPGVLRPVRARAAGARSRGWIGSAFAFW